MNPLYKSLSFLDGFIKSSFSIELDVLVIENIKTKEASEDLANHIRTWLELLVHCSAEREDSPSRMERPDPIPLRKHKDIEPSLGAPIFIKSAKWYLLSFYSSMFLMETFNIPS